MPPLTLSCGEGVLLWLRDRDSLTPGMPTSDLRQAFQSVGISCEARLTDELDLWELVITPREAAQLPPPPMQRVEDRDGFVLSISSLGLRLTGNSTRSLAFAIWELLERMGWEWPTPQIWREPKQRSWEFVEGSEVHRPALHHRILFAEQVEITPDVVRWLSRLRFNTLFPSNPTRFAEPEEQFPEQSLAVAQDLGFDLIAGGNCLAWLQAPVGMEAAAWDDLSARDLKRLEKSTLELWREMGEPKPRLAVWPEEGAGMKATKFLESLLEFDQELLAETALGVFPGPVPADRVLLHHCVSGFPSELETAEILEHLPGAGNEEARGNLYLFLDTSQWDTAIGNLVSPLLWKMQCNWIEAAARQGWGGACLSLTGLPTQPYLERAGFSLATSARAMWSGNTADCQEYNKVLIHSQFEAGAPIVNALIQDAEEFAREASARRHSSRGGPLERVHDFLVTDEARDRLDQRAAELEESPPSEPCLELARSLATLASLHELEECSDVHEERALARTIWVQNGINRWPDWLQAASPLAEYLRNLLK